MGKEIQAAHSSTAILLTALAALSGCKMMNTPVSDSVPPDVGDTNSPPVLQGNPLNSVKVAESYAFQPNASDPDGDALSFSIQNKPRWAQFQANTGRISGMPMLGDEGLYDNISILASDGTASTSLDFSINVTSMGSASVTLSWTPPTENEDGSLLTDLTGYYIYFGDTENDYPFMVHIDNPGISTYVVENLSPKTYYFVATSYNSRGAESQLSNMATIIAEL